MNNNELDQGLEQINKCPYCGKRCHVKTDILSEHDTTYQVFCYYCNVSGPTHLLRAKAISLWNQMQVKEYEEG